MKKQLFRWMFALAILLPCLLLSVAATEEPAYIYVVNVGGVSNGTVTLSHDCGDMGTEVTVTAVPDEGYVLSEILVDGKVIDGNTFIIAGDHTVTATFESIRPIIASGSCSSGVTWTLYADGELVISGNGAIRPYSSSYVTGIGMVTTAPWGKYRDGITAVTIESGITRIGSYSFYCCYDLNQVTIPDSVTAIGESAFASCNGLTSIAIGGSVTTIEKDAFRNCGGLSSVIILDSVTTIGNNAFAYCSNLSEMVIGGGVTTIGNSAFNGCSSLTRMTIPDNVVTLGSGVFSRCSALTEVFLGSGVTTMDSSFAMCESLNRISVSPENRNYCDINGILFDKDLTKLIRCPAKKTTVTIPDSVTTIGSHAFEDCVGLSSATIPTGVTAIGSYAFENCTSLTNITIPNGVTKIDAYTFSNCTALTSVTIPDSVTIIDKGAFMGCTGLTAITIPATVTNLGAAAFSQSGLISAKIPASVTSIEELAFSNCSALTSVEFLGDIPVDIDIKSFRSCNNLTIYYHEGTVGWTDSTHYDVETNTFCGRPIVMISAEDGGEQEDTYFEVDEYKATGTAPVQTDKVFAGWYSDAEYQTPYTKTNGEAQAKFVDKAVLGIKAQITAGTTAESEQSNIRFVTSVDNLKYKKVGFKITFKGETVTTETSTVYSKIVSKSNGDEVNYDPTVFSEQSKYFASYLLTDVPNEYFDDTFTVVSYWMTMDGTVVEGEARELSISMGY